MSFDAADAKATWDTYVFGDFKKTLTRTPVTSQKDNITGDEILVDGTPATFYAIFFRKEDVWKQEQVAQMGNADAIALYPTTATLNKDDKLTFNGEDYRVMSVVGRYLGSTLFHYTARLFKI